MWISKKKFQEMQMKIADLESTRTKLQNSSNSFTTERIVNIHDLESMIISAYDASQIMEAELHSETPNMECIKTMSQIVNENLVTANNFEFRIERRTIYPK